ncbi:hypothetical protein DB346_09665 [Verrucomicrobia bacterium LW23]|nr:hypothetical protein DB346_09665 [Verrucomicrobia bacterium LW23]
MNDSVRPAPGEPFSPGRRSLPVAVAMLAVLLVTAGASLCLGAGGWLSPWQVAMAVAQGPILAPFPTGQERESVVTSGDAMFPPLSSRDIQLIVWRLRMPRVVLAVLAGAALAMAGASMQAVFQNPLADPYVVGASAGAGLGAVAVVWLGMGAGTIAGLNALAAAAFVGALGVTTLVLLVGGQGLRGSVSAAGGTTRLLLTGMAVSGLCAALTTLLLLKTPASDMRTVMAWLMGNLAWRGWSYPAMLAPYVALGGLVLWRLRRQLDVLSVGDDVAHHLGADVVRLRLTLIAIASMLAAATVAACGTIGFIGLLVPHAARRLTAPLHSVLLPMCAIGGGALLLAADLGARTVASAEEVPVGIITAVLGSGFFLWLLRREGVRSVSGQ